MIGIYPGKEKMDVIENSHWDWFKSDVLKNWINRMKRDNNFLKIFFENDDEFNKWFNKGKENTSTWVSQQNDNKFAALRGFILGNKRMMEALVIKLGSGIDKENTDYLIGQYIKLREKTVGWGGPYLVKTLGIRVCPYCNRNFVDVYHETETDSFKTKAQVDHFYCKETYPYLCLSLYNLIPSCYSCNLLKGNKRVDILYPYEEINGGFLDDALISTDFYQKGDKAVETGEMVREKEIFDLDYLNGNSNNFKINFNIKDPLSKKGQEIEQSIKMFKLENVYNLHKDYVREIIKKSHMYNKNKIEEIYFLFPMLFKNKEEVLQTILSNYVNEDELGKRPLAKLVRDISTEFGFGE